jgi:peptidylprolyl isomerase
VDSSAPPKSSPKKPSQRPQRIQLTPAEQRRAAKNERRRAAEVLALKQAKARRQRNAALGVVGVVVVAVVAIVLITQLGGSSKKPSTAAANTACPAAPAVAGPQPSGAPAAGFPQIPACASPALKTKPVVTKGTGAPPTKLLVTTLIQGTGATVKSGDTITVNYVGVTYADGKEFDSSWKNSQTFSTAIGQGGVIKGWDQGLVGVKVGSRVQLDIPTDLAYGTPTPAGDPAGPLRFVVDVLGDTPASASAAPSA